MAAPGRLIPTATLGAGIVSQSPYLAFLQEPFMDTAPAVIPWATANAVQLTQKPVHHA